VSGEGETSGPRVAPGWPRRSRGRAFARADSLLYLPLTALLLTAAAFTLVGTVIDLVEGSESRAIADTGGFLLERTMLMFIIAELLYTLRLVDFGGRILVEPFLFIGLIAVVRRVLVVTAEAEVQDGRSKIVEFAIEIGALGALALVLALSINLLRGSAGDQP
jgi:uncharacterized membrane protein (DUF373 family)